MKKVYPIHNPSFEIRLGCIVYQFYIGNHGTNAIGNHALVGAHAHSPAKQRFTIGDVRRHPAVLVMSCRSKAVSLLGFVTSAMFVALLVGDARVSHKLVMPQLLPQFRVG